MFNIQGFLARNNWSQYDLAKKLGFTRSKVGSWCAGYRRPDYDDICALFKIGMTLNEMFGPEIEAVILKTQPSLDMNSLTPEDCWKIVNLGLSSVQEKLKER